MTQIYCISFCKRGTVFWPLTNENMWNMQRVEKKQNFKCMKAVAQLWNLKITICVKLIMEDLPPAMSGKNESLSIITFWKMQNLQVPTDMWSFFLLYFH